MACTTKLPLDNARQMVDMPTPEEFTALRQALADALKTNESLTGELRVTRTERDLLQGASSTSFKRQLFAARARPASSRRICSSTRPRAWARGRACGRGG
jgi:hypothetical protein